MATNKPPRLYLDSCSYIDVVKGRHGAPLDPDRVLLIPFIENLLLASGDGEVEIWASTLILTECLTTDANQLAVSEAVQQSFVSLLTNGTFVKLQAVDFFVAERARDLRWVDQIRCGRGADMIHVATALELGCEEFITTDRNRGPLQGDGPARLGALGLRVIEASQTSLLPDRYRHPLLDQSGA